MTISTPDGDETSEIRDLQQLPAGEFSLRGVYFDENASAGDADLARFKDVPGIESWRIVSNTSPNIAWKFSKVKSL